MAVSWTKTILFSHRFLICSFPSSRPFITFSFIKLLFPVITFFFSFLPPFLLPDFLNYFLLYLLFWFFFLCLLWSPLSLYQHIRSSQLIRCKQTFLMTVVISERKKEINQMKQEIVLFWEMDIKATAAASSFLLWCCNTFGSNSDVHYFRIRTGWVVSKRK